MMYFQPPAAAPALPWAWWPLPNDRLGVSLFGSALLHLVVILGVSFAFPQWRELKGLPTLEITLVQTASERAPKDAEFLAQANQDGGGTSDKADIARNPLPVREVSDSRRLPRQQLAPQPKVASPREATDLVVLDRSDWSARTREPKPEPRDERLMPWNLALHESPELRRERAQLNAEIDRSWQEYQKRPRRKFLNARTQEYKYAAYMEAWRAKVERVGNLNYPAEARRRGLTGSLVLDVALRADGSLESAVVRRSSGHKLLDEAARRIVEISAPFAAFTAEMKTETDVLHITRTWKFNETVTAE
jgi:protein TonB